MQENFKRMLGLVDEIFDMRNDPRQLQVDEKVLAKLGKLHPATLAEHNVNGPVVWIMLIPTTTELMNKFLSDEISEQEMFDRTNPGMKFDAVYLCSASVLPEFRRKGLAKRMTIDAIRAIQKDHPIQALFVWPFTEEGKILAQKIADELSLPLRIK
ncbi:MAG TPA: hypothetical protein VL651_12485 [Bacteroidia bacterium]|jgi:ribosomal protein S18 acetylase RimI-like enzyme|nr:hypothetical protein [Bacteroidia bacterium]